MKGKKLVCMILVLVIIAVYAPVSNVFAAPYIQTFDFDTGTSAGGGSNEYSQSMGETLVFSSTDTGDIFSDSEFTKDILTGFWGKDCDDISGNLLYVYNDPDNYFPPKGKIKVRLQTNEEFSLKGFIYVTVHGKELVTIDPDESVSGDEISFNCNAGENENTHVLDTSTYPTLQNIYSFTISVTNIDPDATSPDARTFIFDDFVLDCAPGPKTTITSTAQNLTNTSPIPVKVKFSSNVTGFDAGDITVGNGTVSNFQTENGSAYKADIIPSGQGAVTVNIGAGVCQSTSNGNGNNPPASGLSFTYDSVAPDPPSIPDLHTASDTGVSSNDNITKNTTPAFTGTAEAGSIVQLTSSVNGIIGTAAADGSGDWSITSAYLSEGQHDITATAADAAGNTSTPSDALHIVIDTSPPSMSNPVLHPDSDTGESSTDNITKDITPTFAGTADPGSTVEISSSLDGSIGTATADETGEWSITANPLQDGRHIITANATDIAGNIGPQTVPLEIIIDTSRPAVNSVTTTAASPTGTAPIPISVIFSKPVSGFSLSGISVTNGTAGDLTGSGTAYTFNVTPANSGTVSIGIHADAAQDTAGNQNIAHPGLSVVFDNEPPTATVTYSTTALTNGTVTATIVPSEAVTVTNNGGSTSRTFTDNGDFTFEFEDAAGNAGSVIATVANIDKIAPTAPTVTISSDNPNAALAKAGDKVTLSITASEAVQTPTVTIAGKPTAVNDSGDGSDTTWKAEYTIDVGDNEGLAVFTLNFKDLAGNAAAQVTATTDGSTVTFDKTAPYITIMSSIPGTTNAASIPVTFMFSESVVGFGPEDITVGNGTVNNLNQTGAFDYNAEIIPAGQGNVTVDIAAGVVQDAAGNGNIAAPQLIRKYDSIAPAVDDSNPLSVFNAIANTLIVKFTEEGGIATGSGPVNISKFTVRQGAQSRALTSDSTAVITDSSTITITLGRADLAAVEAFAGGKGIDAVDVAAGGITDIAGNSNANDAGNTIATDKAPVLSGAAVIDSTHIEVSLSEDCVNIDKANDGGFIVHETGKASEVYNVSAIAQGTDASHVVLTVGDISASGKEGITVKYSAGANGTIQDLTGNAMVTDSTGVDIAPWDVIPPTVSLSIPVFATNASSIPVTITFSKAVTGFTAGGVTVINGTAGSLSGNGATYTLIVHPTAEGAVTVHVNAAAARDIAGNANTVSIPVTVYYDNTSPSVTLSSAAPDIVKEAPIPFTIDFSENVKDFTVDDITISNGAGSLSGSGNAYTLLVTPATQGAITVSVGAAAAHDEAGNPNTASLPVSRIFDSQAPTVVITTTAVNPVRVSPIHITITFSKPVWEFAGQDITVANGRVESLTGSAITYEADIIPEGQGNVEVTVNAGAARDTAGNYNLASAPLRIYFDDIMPTILSAVLASNNAYVDITFSEGVYGAPDGITPLTADKLQLVFTRNAGSAVNVQTAAVRKADNSAAANAGVLNGGETTIRVFLTVAGTPNGLETVEIKPADASSIYDVSGYAMPAAQSTGIKALYNQVPEPNNNNNGGGNSSSNSGSGSGSNSNNTPTDNRVSILVNGRPVQAGTIITARNGDRTVTTLKVDQQLIEQELKSEGNNAVITIPVNTKSDTVLAELNAMMLKNMAAGKAVIVLDTGEAKYTLPAGQINFVEILKEMGKDILLEDIKVNIEISRASKEDMQIIENAAKKGRFTVVAPAITFNVTCTYGGKTVNADKFSAFVERTIRIPEGTDPENITTGVAVNSDGTVRHVPTKIIAADGKYYAEINSLTNSIYTVIRNRKSFKDLEKHWSQEIANDMASRLIVNGDGEDTFAPDKSITRAEFVSILVSALGLDTRGSSSDFKDIKIDDRYYRAISTAYTYGIAGGYSDGSFKPGKVITRQEAAVMTVNAMKIAGLDTTVSGEQVTTLLAKFKDGGKAGKWAKNSVALCIKYGVIAGNNGLITPEKVLTRAEAAAMVRSMLKKAELI